MTDETKFKIKSKAFRLHFKLTEDDVEALLASRNLKYKGLELGTKTLTLVLAEAYPLIYGIEYCDFKKDETDFPAFDQLPLTTQEYINNRPDGSGFNVGLKGTKNKASYVIYLIKDYPVGKRFLNNDVLRLLPAPLNKDATITWNNGLLNGLVKATKEYKYYIQNIDGKQIKKRGKLYEIVRSITLEKLEKAMVNIDEEWLKSLSETPDIKIQEDEMKNK